MIVTDKFYIEINYNYKKRSILVHYYNLHSNFDFTKKIMLKSSFSMNCHKVIAR